jgi:hypothetical protein
MSARIDPRLVAAFQKQRRALTLQLRGGVDGGWL